AKNHADEREQFLMANLLAALEVALGDVAALAIVDRVRQVADRIYPTSNLSPDRSATEQGSTCCKGDA
ncbi:hypothetical protein SBW75_33250, partial [Pseudomonas aeruginosa]|nr:hypothetical protein [Pseudomonas aeruginosa]